MHIDPKPPRIVMDPDEIRMEPKRLADDNTIDQLLQRLADEADQLVRSLVTTCDMVEALRLKGFLEWDELRKAFPILPYIFQINAGKLVGELAVKVHFHRDKIRILGSLPIPVQQDIASGQRLLTLAVDGSADTVKIDPCLPEATPAMLERVVDVATGTIRGVPAQRVRLIQQKEKQGRVLNRIGPFTVHEEILAVKLGKHYVSRDIINEVAKELNRLHAANRGSR